MAYETFLIEDHDQSPNDMQPDNDIVLRCVRESRPSFQVKVTHIILLTHHIYVYSDCSSALHTSDAGRQETEVCVDEDVCCSSPLRR